MYIYTHTANSPLSYESFPASLLHPNASLLNYSHPILGMGGGGGVLWVQALSRARSPPSRQHAKYAYYLLNPNIHKCALLKRSKGIVKTKQN